jgi:hypothetical protein
MLTTCAQRRAQVMKATTCNDDADFSLRWMQKDR